MEECPVFVRLELQTFLATNEKIAVMLKGRPIAAIKLLVGSLDCTKLSTSYVI